MATSKKFPFDKFKKGGFKKKDDDSKPGLERIPPRARDKKRRSAGY